MYVYAYIFPGPRQSKFDTVLNTAEIRFNVFCISLLHIVLACMNSGEIFNRDTWTGQHGKLCLFTLEDTHHIRIQKNLFNGIRGIYESTDLFYSVDHDARRRPAERCK